MADDMKAREQALIDQQRRMEDRKRDLMRDLADIHRSHHYMLIDLGQDYEAGNCSESEYEHRKTQLEDRFKTNKANLEARYADVIAQLPSHAENVGEDE